MFTVAVLLFSKPSLALYVKLSVRVSLPSWIYVNVPSGFNVRVPCEGFVTKTAVKVLFSASVSFSNMLFAAVTVSVPPSATV